MFGWLKNIFRTKSDEIGPYRPYTVDALIQQAFTGHVSLNDSAAYELYRQSSALSTAVNFIASKIEQFEPVMRSRDGTLDDDGPLLDFLKAPNGFMSRSEFIGAAARHFMVTGNIYFHAFGNTRVEPIEIFAPNPGQVAPFEDGVDDFPERYQLTRRQQSDLFTIDRSRRRQGFGFRYYSGNLQELFPVRGFSSRLHTVRGDTPLESILLEIRQHIQGRRHNNALLGNGARPSSVWFLKQIVGQEQYEQIEETIRTKYTGPHNAGQAILLNGADLDFKDLVINNKDMDFANLDKVAKEAVFMNFHIPIPLITADRQTFNNYETAVQAFYDDAVLPIADRIYEGLFRMLGPRFGIDMAEQQLAVNRNQIPALRSRDLDEIKRRKDIGVETTNEIRELIPGREDIADGDAVLASASAVPVAGDVPEPEPIDPDLDPNAPDEIDEAA